MHEDKKEKQNKKYLLVWSKMMWPFYFLSICQLFLNTRHVIALSVDTLFHFHSLFNSILCPKKFKKKVIFTSQIVCVCIFSFDILRFLLFLSVHCFDFTLSTHSDIDMNRSIDD